MPAAFVWVVFQAELSPMTSDVLMCQVIGRQLEHVKLHLIKEVSGHACAKNQRMSKESYRSAKGRLICVS